MRRYPTIEDRYKLSPEEYQRAFHRPDWRCEDSPTGAHHWLYIGKNYWFCIYCGERTNSFRMEMPSSYLDE